MSKLPCSLCSFWSSSIGKKFIVAITGIILVGFLVGHLSGNLLIFAGDTAFNEYADFLHGMLHGIGIWIARIILLTSLILHVVATIQLTVSNKAAKKISYNYTKTVKATKSSRFMIFSGLTILAFVIFHIFHYTVRVDSDLAALADKGNPHAMVILGFKNIWVSLFYIIAMFLLCSHLSHGVSSIFQTLGLRSSNNEIAINTFSKVFATLIFLGFISIPLAIVFKIVQ